jgi:SAM-dependent methyltransferase
MQKYKHKESVHRLKDANIIVPEIIKLLNPKSVLDIGCGLGTFLHVFKRLGINDILGIDGAWVNRRLLFQYISPEEFQEWNLEKEIKLSKKYDLVLSLEVAEHLSEESSDIFVKSLTNAGNLILFSAAIPYQGGQNHINEQWMTYWEDKFSKNNFKIYDIIRPIFWDNPEVFWWYKQNMVLVAPKDLNLNFRNVAIPVKNLVHYELYTIKAKRLDNIIKGKDKPRRYFKWFLYSVFGYQNFREIKHMLKRR